MSRAGEEFEGTAPRSVSIGQEKAFAAKVRSWEVGELSSDTDAETRPKSGPQWEQFEKDVADFVRRLDDSKSNHNQKVMGRISGTERQIDVYCTGKIAGTEVRIAIECKRYVRPLGIGGVDQFVGKLIDIAAEKGILYSYSGYTEPAKSRARNSTTPRIELRDLTHLREWPDDLREVFDDVCETDMCFATLEWRDLITDYDFEVDDADTPSVLLGTCWSCGSHELRCPKCSERIYDFNSESGSCVDCKLVVQVHYDRSMVEIASATVRRAIQD